MSVSNGTAQKAAALALAALPGGGALTANTTVEILDRDELVTWMRLNADPKRGKRRCVLFSLGARHGEKGVTAITEGDVGKSLGDAQRNAQIDAIAADFDRASTAWVKAHGRLLGFVVGGHKDDDPDTDAHVAFPFTLTPPAGVRENFEGREASDLAGAVAWHHRTLDTVLRLWSKDGQQDKDRMLLELQSARQHNEELTRIRKEGIDEHQRLADGAMLRELTVEEKRLSLDIQRQLSEVLISKGLPMIGAALGASAPDPMLELATALTPDEIVALMQMIKKGPPEREKQLGPAVASALKRLPDEKKAAIAQRMFALEAEGELVIDSVPEGATEPEKKP